MRIFLSNSALAARIGILACLCTATSCKKSADHPAPSSSPPSADSTHTSSNAELALARVDLAQHATASHQPEHALPLLAAALEADASCSRALVLAQTILQNTSWFFPDISLQLDQTSIESLHLGEDSSLWSAISIQDERIPDAEIHTAVKWNLDAPQIESVLFPTAAHQTDCLLLDPTHRYAVIKRSLNSDETTALLCDAQTLRPIRDLGPLPNSLLPSAVIVFSPDGLLLAHPSRTSSTDPSIIWLLRDTSTGEIIRQSTPIPPNHPQPLTASLDRIRLRILSSDATLREIPVSPALTETNRPIHAPSRLLQAQFNEDGTAVEALSEGLGPHRPPSLITIPIDPQWTPLTKDLALLERFPWSRSPTIWTGLLREQTFPPILVNDTSVTFPRLFPSYNAHSSISAVALRADIIAFGDTSGGLSLFRILPLPTLRPNTHSASSTLPEDIPSFVSLSETLTGLRYNPKSRKPVPITKEQRLQALERCNSESLSRLFPSLDFTPITEKIRLFPPLTLPPNAAAPLLQRLTRFLERPRFPEIEDAFANADDDKIRAAIQHAAPSGASAATCLSQALHSTQPTWIHLCLESFPHLPPLLTRIAHTRIAWLENRKADAITAWPDPFPNYDHARLTEEWDGWEAADFRISFELIRQSISSELAQLTVPENATREQRDSIHAKLSNEATLQTLGRQRYARACLDAATRLATFPDETERTFALAQIARAMGAPPTPCLRAEALALTALQDHSRARDRWVELISHHPVADHLSSDYAEAAYSSFENSDPTQAMAILATGMHRFPNDSAFALRAGWIALLTNHPDAAYRFLLAGHHTGWAANQNTHALSLLAIAAFQSGAPEESAAWFQELIRLDPSWSDEKSINSLTWPDELKSVLHHLAQHALVTPNR